MTVYIKRKSRDWKGMFTTSWKEYTDKLKLLISFAKNFLADVMHGKPTLHGEPIPFEFTPFQHTFRHQMQCFDTCRYLLMYFFGHSRLKLCMSWRNNACLIIWKESDICAEIFIFIHFTKMCIFLRKLLILNVLNLL